MIENNLYLFWKIGKYIFDKSGNCDNSLFKCSRLCSYHFGASDVFSLENMRLMKRFYIFFPMFIDRMYELEWKHYKELVKIFENNERMFYYQVALFSKCDDMTLRNLINSRAYYLI